MLKAIIVSHYFQKYRHRDDYDDKKKMDSGREWKNNSDKSVRMMREERYDKSTREWEEK